MDGFFGKFNIETACKTNAFFVKWANELGICLPYTFVDGNLIIVDQILKNCEAVLTAATKDRSS